MAKRKKTKCPEPFNTLLDIAEAITLDIVYSKMREKDRQKGRYKKIDPYAATGIAMGLGKINNTEDLIRFGGFLGAMGAFDDEDLLPNLPKHRPSHIVNNNKYAWRLNCEDGADFGIYPENFETRASYNNALNKAKTSDEINSLNISSNKEDVTVAPEVIDTCQYQDSEVKICHVSILKNGQTKKYIFRNDSIKVGDIISVTFENGSEELGVVVMIETEEVNAENINLPEIE